MNTKPSCPAGGYTACVHGLSFVGYTKLETRNLSFNQFTLFNSATFTPLINLKHLFLQGDLMHIPDLDPSTFDGLTSLASVNIRNNNRLSFRNGIFEDLPNMETIFLGGNPVESVGLKTLQIVLAATNPICEVKL